MRKELMRVDASKYCLSEFCLSCPIDRHCCYRADTIVVMPEEREMIVRKTGKASLFITELHGLFTISKERGKPCPFLTNQNLCSIYEIRPLDCRTWPLTLNKISSSNLDTCLVDLGCPPAETKKLSMDFFKSAQNLLESISDSIKPYYAKLVHRDSFNLGVIKFTSEEE